MTKQLNRNDPCWCGSGKKYKNCHLRQDRAEAQKAELAKQPAVSPEHQAAETRWKEVHRVLG